MTDELIEPLKVENLIKALGDLVEHHPDDFTNIATMTETLMRFDGYDAAGFVAGFSYAKDLVSAVLRQSQLRLDQDPAQLFIEMGKAMGWGAGFAVTKYETDRTLATRLLEMIDEEE